MHSGNYYTGMVHVESINRRRAISCDKRGIQICNIGNLSGIYPGLPAYTLCCLLGYTLYRIRHTRGMCMYVCVYNNMTLIIKID